jgi:hypothetical protein
MTLYVCRSSEARIPRVGFRGSVPKITWDIGIAIPHTIPCRPALYDCQYFIDEFMREFVGVT